MNNTLPSKEKLTSKKRLLKALPVKLALIGTLVGGYTYKAMSSEEHNSNKSKITVNIENKTNQINKEENSEWKNLIEQATQELIEDGIPAFQKTGYVKGKSEKAFHNINPQAYGDWLLNVDRYRRFKNNLGRNKNELLWVAKGEKISNGTISKKNIYYDIPKRDDAFLLYLGMGQKHHSFGISDYQPTKSMNPMKIYFKPNYRTSGMKQSLLDRYFLDKDIYNSDKNKGTTLSNERMGAFEFVRDSLEKKGLNWEDPRMAEWVLDNPLGDFSITEGQDEKGYYVAIYDIRDLQPFGNKSGASKNKYSNELVDKLGEKGYKVDENTEVSSLFGAGRPFEIYDRIYYNPTTKKII